MALCGPCSGSLRGRLLPSARKAWRPPAVWAGGSQVLSTYVRVEISAVRSSRDGRLPLAGLLFGVDRTWSV